MTFDELKDKALSLPMAPGVYIMQDSSNQVIYVGKAKKLKNRVSQYFQDTATHSPKTRLMVSKIHHFDVVVAASEFEALILECSLIKQHMPKYNILLKDDKGFPYVRLNMKEPYPKLTIVNKTASDGAEYFGPYGSRGVTQNLLEVIRSTFQLPGCNKLFPRDIAKDRPCLNYHMNECAGWCQSNASFTEYRSTMEMVRRLLLGNYKEVTSQIREEMLQASNNLEFELAASLRDRLNAVETLGNKQMVTAINLADTDVIGYAQSVSKACFTVLHFHGGNLLDKEYEILPLPDDREAALSSLVKQYYLQRGFAPRHILLPFAMDDSALFCQLLQERFGCKTQFSTPQRGEKVRLVELASTNAEEEVQRATTKEEHISATVTLLGRMLNIPLPKRIEAYDISNISGTDIVAGMVVYQDGKPRKKDYKRFKMEGLINQDDYASMAQVIKRRFSHFKAQDNGFSDAPDLLLIDGGITHAATAVAALAELKLHFPVFGMVKDDRHRTRALVTPDGKEIRIDNNQAIFSLIGNIQEEVHRFAIGYHRKLRSNRLRYSELDSIDGIGPKRKQDLLKKFQSIAAISAASLWELETILPQNAAYAVYRHFHPTKETGEKLCE